jgi:hypothetical protein
MSSACSLYEGPHLHPERMAALGLKVRRQSELGVLNSGYWRPECGGEGRNQTLSFSSPPFSRHEVLASLRFDNVRATCNAGAMLSTRASKVRDFYYSTRR